MVKDSALALCVICNAREARSKGPECRVCYKRNKQRKYRQEADPPEDRITLMSLEANMYEVDRMAYRDWMNNQ